MNINVAVVIPFRIGDCEHRDKAYEAILQHLKTYHSEWPIVIGSDDSYPHLSIARARNNGASLAEDADVMIFHDADSMVHPDALREAVQLAYDTDKLVFAANAHMYCDELSTHRYLATGMWFPMPTTWPDSSPTYIKNKQFDPQSIYRDPSGGVLAVSRHLWRATGGYVHSLGGQDSFEDLVFFAQCQIFGKGITRVAGMQLHCWHPPAPRHRGENHKHYNNLVRLMRASNAQARAREYLQGLGHCVP